MPCALSAMWKKSSPMRFDRHLLCLLLAAALLLPGRYAFAEGTAPSADVLVIYPAEAEGRGESLAGIAQVVFSLGLSADYRRSDRVGSLSGWENVIWCGIIPDRMPPRALSAYSGRLLLLGAADGLEDFGVKSSATEQAVIGVASYTFEDGKRFQSSVPINAPGFSDRAGSTAGSLEFQGGQVPLATSLGSVRYVALTDYSTEFAKAVLAEEMSRWLWPYESAMHTYAQYLVLDEVYPFTDPERLWGVVKRLTELRMDYIISVMPIYEHADYPAMRQFCEILRYAQANGGTVILHAPITQNTLLPDQLAQRLTDATRSYLDNDVYPIALEIPSEWLFRPELIDLLGRYRTLFFSDMDAFSHYSPARFGSTEYFRKGFRQIVPTLRLEDSDSPHQARFSSSSILRLDELTDEELYAAIDTIKNAPFPVQSLWEMDQAVYLNGGGTILWDGHTLRVDGKESSRSFEPGEPVENYNYKRDIYYRFVADLSNQNYLLIGLSAETVLIFMLLVLRARRQMHRRFLHPKPAEEGASKKE